MGLTWAVVWAVAAVLIGMLVDPDGSMDEIWPAIGAYPGFLGGVVFSVVLAVAARRRGLDELSLPTRRRLGRGGRLSGGRASVHHRRADDRDPPVAAGGVVIGTITVLSAASAAGSLALARMGERRELGAGADVPGLRAGPHRQPIGRQGPARVADRVASGRVRS